MHVKKIIILTIQTINYYFTFIHRDDYYIRVEYFGKNLTE